MLVIICVKYKKNPSRMGDATEQTWHYVQYLRSVCSKTRTTRTPAFWGYPPPPHDYPYHWVILDPKSKEDKVKVTNLKNSPKFQILKRALHTTHFLELLDNMCKYEMDPMSIVEDTERTRLCPQTDKVIPVYPTFQLRWSGGYNHGQMILKVVQCT